jgi:dTDP-glucose 4,6-dehydratase
MITNALEGMPLPVYGDGRNVRDWIHVEDHCEALVAALEEARAGEVYNIGGGNEWANIDLVKLILEKLGKPEALIRFVPDRLGHDRRYAIDAAKLERDTGFAPRTPFDQGLERTIGWYVENRAWWQSIKSGAYRDYYERMYGRGGRHDAGGARRARSGTKRPAARGA